MPTSAIGAEVISVSRVAARRSREALWSGLDAPTKPRGDCPRGSCVREDVGYFRIADQPSRIAACAATCFARYNGPQQWRAPVALASGTKLGPYEIQSPLQMWG
jgi:hypothetical protein